MIPMQPPDRGRTSWAVGASAVMALLLLLLTTGCNHNATSAARQPASSHRGAMTALPPFSDWRPAYVDSNRHLDVTTMSGQGTLVGPELPDLAFNGLVVGLAGISPNGHLLAYSGANGLRVLDLTGRLDTSQVPNIEATELFWSQDSKRIALGDGQGHIGVVDILSGSYTYVPGLQQQQGLASIIGWTDETHLAVTVVPPVSTGQTNGQTTAPTSVTVATLDTSTWHVHSIATVQSAGLGTPHFALSPDATHVFFYNKQFSGSPYTPLAAQISLASGSVTLLPHITAAMGPYSGFTSLAWRDDGQTIAASTGFATNSDLKTWLLEPQQDTAVPLSLPQAAYVAAWAPLKGPLILTSGWQSLINGGPYELSAVAVDTINPPANVTPILLSRDVVTFPFVGFVRSGSA